MQTPTTAEFLTTIGIVFGVGVSGGTIITLIIRAWRSTANTQDKDTFEAQSKFIGQLQIRIEWLEKGFNELQKAFATEQSGRLNAEWKVNQLEADRTELQREVNELTGRIDSLLSEVVSLRNHRCKEKRDDTSN